MSAKVELTKTRKILSTPDMSLADPLLNVAGALAGSELEHEARLPQTRSRVKTDDPRHHRHEKQ